MQNSRNNRSKILHTDIIQKYLDGYSTCKLAKLADVSNTAIWYILKRNNINIRLYL